MSTDIAQQSVVAAKWGVISSSLKFAMQLAVNVAIARLLGPDAFGLFALASIGLLVATFLSEVGLGWSLMQRPALDDEVIRFVFTWQSISGLLGFALMSGAAYWMADLLRDPRLVEVMRWLGLCCLLNGLAATATNLLRRELRFRDLAKVQLLSYALAYGLVGLPLAALGYGVWALVWAWVTQALLGLLLAYRARPHALRPKWSTTAPGEFVNIGFTVLITNLCNWALTNLDRLILGRVLGTQAAGYYAVGYNLATVPNGLLISGLQPAFLASGARLQDEPERLARGYLEVQYLIWVVLAPLFALLAFVGADVIAVLYGEAWMQSTPVFMLLALAMPAYLAWALSTPVLWNTGRKHWESLLQLPILLIAGPVLYWAAGQSISLVAAVAAASFAVRAIIVMGAVWIALGLRSTEVVSLGARSSTVGLLVVGTAMLLGAAATAFDWAPWLSGSAKGLAGLAAWLLLIWAFPRLLGQPSIKLLLRFLPVQWTWTQNWRKRATSGHS
ncbi:lipopolysaccharide biosynthesis protein [Inhella sp.]|uniref:lipopolysaccharide biosynthesis protein n=1 Tax=Inhella sp. TaxID=1921806 RepID=UPI0035B0950C